MRDLRLAGVLVAVAALTAPLAAQDLRFFYPAPQAGTIEARRDVPYGELKMDVYRPTNAGALPALIFFNTATGAQRSNPFYKAWAEIAASKQLVAILPDLGAETFAKDFDALLAHLRANGPALGVDVDRIAVYAGSGNVSRALPLVQDPTQTTIASAVMYYGAAEVARFRRDLPVLFVRAGLDRPAVNREIVRLATAALTDNAPVTVLNYPGGHHGFEVVDDDGATREVIDRTIEFIVRTTEPSYRASTRRGVGEATAAALVASGRFAEAAAAYAPLVQAKPDDPRLRLSYGEALLGAAKYSEACAELEKLKGKGLGPRDLGLPAARSCMLNGNGDAAVAWLRTIPQRFLPRDVEAEPTFAPIKDLPAFKALFQPPAK